MWQGACIVRRVCMTGGGVSGGGGGGGMCGMEEKQPLKRGSMPPTGMHSCPREKIARYSQVLILNELTITALFTKLTAP